MSKIYITIIFVLILSCSSNKSVMSSGNTVDMGNVLEVKTSQPKIDKKKVIGTYGPTPDKVVWKNNVKRVSSIALVIGPGMYNTLSSINFLKCLEKTDVAINLVSGIGFGGIVAALYAQNESLELIEWMLFKELRRVQESTLSAGDWLKLWSSFARSKIDSKRLKRSRKSYWSLVDSSDELIFSNKINPILSIIRQINYWKDPNLIENLKRKEINFSSLPVDKIVFLDSISLNSRVKLKDKRLEETFKSLGSVFNEYNKKDDILYFNISKSLEIDNTLNLVSSSPSREECLSIAEKLKDEKKPL